MGKKRSPAKQKVLLSDLREAVRVQSASLSGFPSGSLLKTGDDGDVPSKDPHATSSGLSRVFNPEE